MDWCISCFLDEKNIFREIHCDDNVNSIPLCIHLNKCIGLEMSEVLPLSMSSDEIFSFEGEIYHASTIPNCLGQGKIIYIDSTYVQAKVFENVLNQVKIGMQIFNKNGNLIFLNETSRRIESLIKQNVLNKHLKEIYSLDENYSTILNTIKYQKPVENRCDKFKNRFGDSVISVNSGYPLYIEDRFFGAFSIVFDLDTLSEFTIQKDVLQQFLETSKGKPSENYHINNRYYTFPDIIGISDGMRNAVNVAEKVAPSEFPVLLLGETGTGKEIFAQSIHSSSQRQKKKFIAINCAAIPTTILESTLFGTVKGSFTGSSDQNGLLDEANGGTLFLDELNSMDIQMQSKLLRVLQEKNFRRVGGLKDIDCDFRVIAAMNESPETAIANHRLRTDLYYRLNTITIEIPPLRQRTEDIPVLVDHYIEKLSHSINKEISGITGEAEAALKKYDWPGNIRELFHTLDYAFTIAESDLIDLANFPQRLSIDKESSQECKNILHYDINKRLQEQEKHMIEDALKLCDDNVSKAARLLNLSRQSLQYRIKKCNVKMKTRTY